MGWRGEGSRKLFDSRSRQPNSIAFCKYLTKKNKKKGTSITHRDFCFCANDVLCGENELSAKASVTIGGGGGGFCPRVRILGECSTFHFLPAHFFVVVFFFVSGD